MDIHIGHFLTFMSVEKGASGNTVAAYKNDLQQFDSFVTSLNGNGKARDWDKAERDLIVEYLLSLRRKNYAEATVARKVAALKSFFQFGVSEGLVGDNPTSALDAPKVKKRLPRTLTSDDVERLLAAPTHAAGPKSLRDIALLELLYATGVRVTELVMLEVDDVNLAAGIVRVRHGKGGKERIIPIHERAVQTLRDYIEKSRPVLVRSNADTSALFLNHRGQRLTRQGAWLIIKDYAQAAGIQTSVTPHMLRHSFATHMLESQKATLVDVQHFLGHANISTTQIYTQVTGEHKRRVYDEAHPRAKEPTAETT